MSSRRKRRNDPPNVKTIWVEVSREPREMRTIVVRIAPDPRPMPQLALKIKQRGRSSSNRNQAQGDNRV